MYVGIHESRVYFLSFGQLFGVKFKELLLFSVGMLGLHDDMELAISGVQWTVVKNGEVFSVQATP